MFARAKLDEFLWEVSPPHVRNTWCRVNLDLTAEPTITDKRRQVTRIVQALKATAFSSAVPDSKEVLWITKHKTPPERERVRAVVQCKEYLSALFPNGPAVELDWRGGCWIERENLLGNSARTRPTIRDLIVSDNRGNHTPWFVRVDPLLKLTGLDLQALQDKWQSMGFA